MKTFVCRCEDVTLAEIDHAIALGHDDIESLKRYTGFGTGACQGKSCLASAAARLREKGGDPGTGFTARPPYHPLPLALLAGLPEPAREAENAVKKP
jgi:bacterioferritin-associated ferredoxin